MSKYTRETHAQKDANQNRVVCELNGRGYTVQEGHDDFIVGKFSYSRWIELKIGSIFKRNGKIRIGFIKDSQYRILWGFTGQYNICWTVQQIMNCFPGQHGFQGINPVSFKEHYQAWLEPKELDRLRVKGIIVDGVMPSKKVGLK